MRRHALVQLSLAKLREMFREPEMIFWTFVFPILMAIGLGVAFGSRGDVVLPVGVQQAADAQWYRQAIDDAPGLSARVLSPEQARRQLRTGKVTVVVIPGETTWTYWSDPTRQESRLARLAVNEALQAAAGRRDAHATAERAMTEKGSRYIDFLIPGLLGLNLLGTGMWGIGYYVVNARSKKLLKRLAATPMPRAYYLLAQVLGRLVFLAFEVGVLLGFGRLAFGVPLRGSLTLLAAVTVLGAFTFSGMGLLLASRTRTVEGMQGMMNVVMLPMWIVSGSFFSAERFPQALQPLIQALPLTAVNDALRAVMLDGSPATAIAGELAILAAWCLVSFGGALARFRWS